MPVLSVIVPVFNVAPFLRFCLDSIMNQTFSDLEVIMIDDGSTDESGSICDEYAARDERFKVIHQANSGVSAARNVGLGLARGDYLGFVDADDWIEADMYEKMIRKAVETKTSIIVCGVRYVGDSVRNGEEAFVEARLLSKHEMLEEVFSSPNRLGGGNCNKLFVNKRVSFDTELVIGEDVVFLFDNIMLADGGCQISDVLYDVREREDSATRKSEENTLKLSVDAYEKLVRKAQNCSVEIQSKSFIKFMDTVLRLMKMTGNSSLAYRSDVALTAIRKCTSLYVQKIITTKQFFSAIAKILM